MELEKRANIKFCVRLGQSFTQTLDRLRAAYGDKTPSKTNTFKWFEHFKNGRESLDDDPHNTEKSAFTKVKSEDNDHNFFWF